jgi:hypothetical protein
VTSGWSVLRADTLMRRGFGVFKSLVRIIGLAVCLFGATGCLTVGHLDQTDIECLAVPVYRLPAGYSSTFEKHLLQSETTSAASFPWPIPVILCPSSSSRLAKRRTTKITYGDLRQLR